MELHLDNGYPYPYPSVVTHPGAGMLNAQILSGEYEQASVDAVKLADDLAEEAHEHTLVLHGVEMVQWLHTLTVEFVDAESFMAAQRVTGWAVWDEMSFVLEAGTSDADGYGHPAILCRGRAYCGFRLLLRDVITC